MNNSIIGKQSIPGASNPLKEDGLAGKNTISRIELFQKHLVKMVKPDGRIDPQGKSFKILSSSQDTQKLDKNVSSSLTLSTKGANLLKSIEGLELKPYDDQTGKEIKTWVK